MRTPFLDIAKHGSAHPFPTVMVPNT